MYVICAECGKRFRTEDRVTPSATAGAEVQVLYCSQQCKRKKQNRDEYNRRKEKK